MCPLWVMVDMEIEIKPPCYATGKCTIREICAAEHHADCLIYAAFELARRITLAEMGNGKALVCQCAKKTADLRRRWLCDVCVEDVLGCDRHDVAACKLELQTQHSSMCRRAYITSP